MRAIGIAVLVSLSMLTACQQPKTEFIHVGPNWAAVNDLKPSDKTFDVSVRGKQSYAVGDEVELKVTSKEAGQLWIVRVDPNDEVGLIYPNDFVESNDIAANKAMEIPGEEANWSIAASEPVGKSVVAVIVTTGNTDLRDVFDQKGSMSKALQIVEAAPSWGLSKHVIDVTGE